MAVIQLTLKSTDTGYNKHFLNANVNRKKTAASKVILLHCDTVVIINARKSSTGLNLTITNGP